MTHFTGPTITAPEGRGNRAERPEPGQTVGRYLIVSELGAGAMGTVFLAEDAKLQRKVALKVLAQRSPDDRLLDEARALAKLQHPNVVAVHDVGHWRDQVYMAMELVDGQALSDWLPAHPGWRERLAAFEQAAHGLAAAHRAGIVHHDIKPSNIMVGNDGRVRLVDFGLARSTSPDLAAGSPGGTPRYMSPEQRRGEAADARTDQFSLCVALYEALFGEYPFPGDTSEERGTAALEARVRVPRPGAIPPRTVAAIVKGLARVPAERHATMEAFLEAVAPRRASRAWLAGAGGVAIVAAAALAVIVTRHPPTAPAGRWDAILAASHLAPEQHDPIPGDPYQVTVHRLSNGLTVIISPNHDRPRIRALLRFRGGSADAPGVSAIALGMTFKGTEQIGTVDYAAEKPYLDRIAQLYGDRAAAKDDAARARIDEQIDAQATQAARYEIPNEYTRVLEDLGSTANTLHVAGDETRFEIEIPSNRFAAWAELEADRFTHPVMRLFRSQVAETLGQNAAPSLDARVADVVEQAMFVNHPTLRDRLHALEREPYREVLELMHDRYVPNNAELALAGDVDPITAIPILERAFAGWEPRPLPPAGRIALAPSLPTEVQHVTSAAEQQISYHWVAPLATSPDFAAFAVLTSLFTKLTTDAAGGIRVVHGLKGRDLTSIYSVTATPPVGRSLDDAAQVIDRAAAQIIDGKFTTETLDILERGMKIRELVADDNQDRLRLIGNVPIGGLAWRDRVAMKQRRDHVTREEVMRVARAVLGRPHVTVRTESGPVDKEPLRVPKVPAAQFPEQRSKPARELVERKVVPIQPQLVLKGRDFDERITPAGRVVTRRDRDTKTFALHVEYALGSVEIPLVCTAVISRTSSPELRALVWRYGLKMNTNCTQRRLTIDFAGLDEDLPHALEMFGAVFAPPSPAEWSHSVGRSRRWIADQAASPAYIQGALGAKALADPDAMLSIADDELFRTATPEMARDSLALLARTERSVGYYGPRTTDELIALLPARPEGPGAAPVAMRVAPLDRPRVLLLSAPGVAKDVSVHIGFGLGRVDPEHEAELRLYREYWNPDNQPLAQRLRGVATPAFEIEDATLARDDGTARFELTTTAASAASVIGQVLDEAFKKDLDPAILERAKTSWDELIRGDWSAPEDIPAQIIGWREDGYTDDPLIGYLARLPSIGTKELAWVTDLLRRSPRVITIWGNLDGLDRKALAAYGDVTEISIEDLFPHRK